MTDDRYSARCASDRDPNWPFWFVADRDRGGLNCTGALWERLTGESAGGAVLCGRQMAETIADLANAVAARAP